VLQNAPVRAYAKPVQNPGREPAFAGQPELVHDSVSQLRPTEARLLRFYIAEKSNQKSKRYYSFEVELPAVQRDQGIDSSKAGQLMNHVAETLNAKFMESRGIRNPHLRKKDQPAADSSQPETGQQKKERMEAELRPIKKRSVLVLPTQDYKKELFQERLKRKADELYVQSEKDELLGQLQKKVSFANTPANEPLMWSRIALKQSGLYKDYQRILEDLIDPRLIYFDSALTQGQIDECTNRVMELSRGCCRAAWTSSCKWTGRSWHRQLVLGHPDPGLLLRIAALTQIPYNFTIKEVVLHFKSLLPTILEQRRKYKLLFDDHRDTLKWLQKENNMTVQLDQEFSGIADISAALLMLKRLARFRLDREIVVVPLRKQDWLLFCSEYKFSPDRTCACVHRRLVCLWEFDELEMGCAVQGFNQEFARLKCL
jgi:hypothetical protein